ncbi:MAG: hypothetical protein Q7T55_11185, partial [Solirubrobacteraceae bacterium]|nr:hypothetical protein [Solirubrobacteraceae bacterium]
MTWFSYQQNASGYGIYAQRYGNDGTAVGGEINVNTAATSYQAQSPAIASLSDGGYIVTWRAYGQDGLGYGIFAQRYAADGTAFDNEFRVNTTTTSYSYYPDIESLSDGGYVVTWTSYQSNGPSYDVYARRYAADGVASGNDVLVNTVTVSDQIQSSIASLSDGGYVVTWMSYQQDGDRYDIYAQRYGNDG